MPPKAYKSAEAGNFDEPQLLLLVRKRENEDLREVIPDLHLTKYMKSHQIRTAGDIVYQMTWVSMHSLYRVLSFSTAPL